MITATPHADSPHHFGKLLIERRATWGEIAIPALLAVGFFLFGTFFLILGILETVRAGVVHQKDGEGLAIVLMAILVSLGIAAYCWLSLQTVLRCYELGIAKTTPLGIRELRFDELESLTFSKKMQRHNTGAELGYSYRMQFQPLPSSGRTSIELTIHPLGKAHQLEIEDIRDHVADIVAERMSAELERNGTVPWTPFMRITHNGLECAAKKGWQLVAWKQLRMEVEGDEFLNVYDASYVGLVVGVGQICDNFYPGLIIVTGKLAELAPAQSS